MLQIVECMLQIPFFEWEAKAWQKRGARTANLIIPVKDSVTHEYPKDPNVVFMSVSGGRS